MQDIHVGLILDGNRRWARARGLQPWEGHSYGFEKLKEMIDWIPEFRSREGKFKLKEISLYCFSLQNFARPEIEKKHLFDVFRREIDQLLDNDKLAKHQIKVRFVGRIDMFPADMSQKMREVMEKTKDYNQYILNFALAYGGQEEIVDTVNKMIKEGKEITEKSLQENMWVPENLDVVIRTSGEQRLSNFFMWQASYAEIFFIKKHWPDITKEDIDQVITEFEEKRQRRFGK